MSSEHGKVRKDGRLAAFLQDFGDERKCEDALYAARWPDGFECRGCGGDTWCRLRTRQLFQCNSCKNQVSLTAGTLFSWTKLPLTSWFLAIHLIMRSGRRISGAELSRRLGVNQNTALKMKRKILAALQDPKERSALRVLVHRGRSTAS
ncbi:MAG: IS1595 family transposase [Bryobacterales bacterium]|nr:IS1595 family transposase [Bryobacterales bacterium]